MPVGTLVLPDPADVRFGVLYGADGDEFIGTLVVPSRGSTPFDFQARLQEITRQIPDLVTVNYEPRGAGDTYGSPVAFEARRGRITSGDAGDLAKAWCVWYLYATAGQSVKPARLGRITDPDGLKFDVYDTTAGFGNLHFVCNTVQQVASGT